MTLLKIVALILFKLEMFMFPEFFFVYFLGSLALWVCDGATGTFETIEPDRSECKPEWIEDVEEKVSLRI